MTKYDITIIGQFHTNHNEDGLFSSEIGKNKLLLAVMDGCSAAIESHFSSTLTAKLLKRIAKEEDYLAFIQQKEKNTDELLKDVLRQLFKDLAEMKNKIGLEREELLNTLILGILDTVDKTAEIIVIGDGLIACNGQLFEYDQDNKPDYLGYHLNENFDDWFSMQTQVLSLKNIQDLSVSTDGIFTFKPFNNKKYVPLSEEKIIENLLFDTTNNHNPNMLKNKILELEEEYGLKPSDDLTIIRVIDNRIN
ncbi:MAG: hypothetical protein RIR11_3466 [Bacteroidota bacterium]